MKSFLRAATRVTRKAASNWNRHHTALLGAGISYYAIFSLPPLLIIITAITGAIFGQSAAEGALVHNVERFVGIEVAEEIQKIVLNARKSGAGTAGTVGVLFLLFGASKLFQHLQTALNVIWETEKKSAGIKLAVAHMLKERAIHFVTLLSIGLLLIMLLLMEAIIAVVKNFLNPALPFLSNLRLWQWVSLAASIVLLGIFIGAMYRFLPDTDVTWRDVFVGAAFSSFGISICRVFISLYFQIGGVDSVYHVAGSALVLLIGTYFSFLIFLAGAELAASYAKLHREVLMRG